MICPKCRRSFFFLNTLTEKDGAHCDKCGFRGPAALPSYQGYHEELYLSKSYIRTPKTDPQMQFILKALKIQKNDRVADLGCGVGDYTSALAKESDQVTGFDLNVEAAHKKYPGLSFSKFDFARPIPLPDSSTDKIVSINTIEHLTDPEFFLKECRRILKPGGLIALSTANKEFVLHDFHYDATHLHEWTAAEFSALTGRYFKKRLVKKDCAMFKYYPLNLVLKAVLRPDITFLGERS